jgi:transposase
LLTRGLAPIPTREPRTANDSSRPLNRQSAAYAREGVEIDVSTLADWVGATVATLVRSFS